MCSSDLRQTTFAPLARELDRRQIEYVDLTAAFREAQGDAAKWFMSGGHYSPAGNRIVAQMLGRELLRRAAEKPSPGRLAAPYCPASGRLATN